MPRAPKPCNEPGCPNLVHDDRRRCDIHYEPWQGKSFDKRRSNTVAHKAFKKSVLEKAQYRCAIRYATICIGLASEVDRIDNSGEYTADNCQAACQPCHRKKTSIEGHRAQGHSV